MSETMGGFDYLVTILGLAATTLLTRGFFFFSSKPIPLPRGLLWALRAAPLAAMAAVVVPQIVMTEGHLVTTWQDARLWGTAAAVAWFFWQRSLLGTIVTGMGVYLPLRLVLGW
jgi:branched-subunit amino acid transport protein